MAPVKSFNITLRLYNGCLLCAASGWDTDNRLCLFVCVPFSRRAAATAVRCTARPSQIQTTAAGREGRGQLSAKFAAAASRMILLDIIWSRVSSNRPEFKKVYSISSKKRQMFSFFFSEWHNLTEGMCISNPFILLVALFLNPQCRGQCEVKHSCITLQSRVFPNVLCQHSNQ